jgi:hypothetical protein
MSHFSRIITPLVIFAFMFISSNVSARDWYVSLKTGKGKSGTKVKPAKELAYIIAKLQAGDIIHIAEGVYLGKGDNGTHVITVPVEIYGGYSSDFSTRDPWGKHKTIFSGDHKSKNYQMTPALAIDLMKVKLREGYPGKIVVDGLILDHGARNSYKTDKNHKILRLASAKKGTNPSPESGALVISASKNGMFDKTAWNILVQNNIIMNSAPTMGAMSISAYKKSKVEIRNNLIINNTGTGLYVGSKFAGAKNDVNGPTFLIENNSILFTWKHDPIAQSFSGNVMDFDASVRATVRNNVLAFADRHIIYNPRSTTLLMQNNVMAASVDTEYVEFNTKIVLDEMEDEADHIHEDSEGNEAKDVKVAISKDWLKLYGSRVLIDRNKAEADIKASATRANQLRSMLGLNLQAGDQDFGEGDVWLPRLSIEDAIKAGSVQYHGAGCKTPAKVNVK